MRRILPWFLLLAAPAALAHGGHQGHGGLVDGLLHPLLGLDHLLAALAVGLWAGRMEGPVRLAAPLAFAVTMLFAAAFGLAVSLPDWLAAMIEPGIAVSLMALGLLLTLPSSLRPAIALSMLPALAVVHGLAHGTEGMAGAGPAYLAGLGASTLALHATGLLLALRMTPRLMPNATRGFSLIMLASGMWALL
ncbi:MAG: HupE/UreJ family protein [Pseudomonadota bacterium]